MQAKNQINYLSTQISLPDGFQQIRPPEAIRHIVQYIWRYDNTEDLTTVAVPEGATDIVFELSGKNTIIFGPSDQPFYFRPFRLNMLGFCLYPGYLEKLTGVPVNEFINSSVIDIEILGFSVMEQWWERPSILCQKFCEHILTSFSGRKDEEIQRIILPIFNFSGQLPTVHEWAYEANLTARTLQRKSLKLFGVPPKTLLKTIRFQKAITILKSGGSFQDATHGGGYADQAHFCRDFKIFTHKSPSNYFPRNNQFK
ncbi:helix-turn-helix domain-containing protein [Desulforhopalus sp. 52FAK]